jgi:hypothetical protein
MTPDERQMIQGLFDRMRQQGAVDKDRDAEALIRDAVRQNPDAAYMLVQTALVQEMVMQQSQERIQELEARVQQLEAPTARPQQQSSGSFLGGLFGGGARPAAVPPTGPAVGRQSGGFGAAPMAGRPSSPWGSAPGAQMQGGAPMQQQAAGGGGFMKSAMATAAGVAGGMLVAGAISNMLKGDTAQASPASQAGANDPAGAYDANQGYQDDNDAAGSYDAAQEDAGGYDDGGSWDE